MIRAAFLAPLGLLLAAAAPTADVDELIEAERNFARMAGERGVNTAFRANIADDGILFRPAPVNGKQWLADQPNPPGTLEWAPAYAEIACSGDIGWTTGPFHSQSGPNHGYGHFVTIWKRQADGSWRFLVDEGVLTKAAAGEVPAKPTRVTHDCAALPKPTGDAFAAVQAADKSFSALAETGDVTKRAGLLTDDVRLHRTGSQPVVGKAAVLDALARDPQRFASVSLGGEASASGDFAYTYGRVVWKEPAPEHDGHYLRIWRRTPEQGWQLVLDQVSFTPQPPAPPAPGNR